jgi:hypothetical protein
VHELPERWWVAVGGGGGREESVESGVAHFGQSLFCVITNKQGVSGVKISLEGRRATRSRVGSSLLALAGTRDSGK